MAPAPSYSEQDVETPEQVSLVLPLAGPGSRILAFALDAIVLVVLMGFIAAAIVFVLAAAGAGGMLPATSDDFSDMLSGQRQFFLVIVTFILIVQFVANCGYFIACELLMNGQSIGKRGLGLRVVRDGGYPLGVSASLIRNFMRIVDLLPGGYLLGLAVMIASKQHKRLGDYAAGTVVVRVGALASDIEPFAGMTHSGLPARRFSFERQELGRFGRQDLAVLRRYLQALGRLPPAKVAILEEEICGVLARRLQREPLETGERADFIKELFLAGRDSLRRG